MSTLTLVYAALFYAATLVWVLGVAWKIWSYARTPAPLKIPTTPAPTTAPGVVFRLFREVVFFASLFRSNKWTWLFGWLFHFGLLLVLLRHLRYFTEPTWFWVDLIQPFGKYGAIAMIVGLVGLWGRRVLVDRVRYISAPSDHLMLALLLAIGISGALMTFSVKVDIIGLKAFFLGLMQFDIQPLPADNLVLFHLAAVLILLIIFPYSKLLHAPGVFFSPTLNQVDNPRERRHETAWMTRDAAQASDRATASADPTAHAEKAAE